jgi:hypothetical protein
MPLWVKLLIYCEISSENTKDNYLFQQVKTTLGMEDFHTNLFLTKKN